MIEDGRLVVFEHVHIWFQHIIGQFVESITITQVANQVIIWFAHINYLALKTYI